MEAFWKAFEEPFSFIEEYGGVEEITKRTIHNYAFKDLPSAGEFPQNIASVYWHQTGEHDQQPWIAIGRLDNHIYFYYTAWCDFTGFDCQGEMQLYLSESKDTLLKYLIPYNVYVEVAKSRKDK